MERGREREKRKRERNVMIYRFLVLIQSWDECSFALEESTALVGERLEKRPAYQPTVSRDTM